MQRIWTRTSLSSFSINCSCSTSVVASRYSSYWAPKWRFIKRTNVPHTAMRNTLRKKIDERMDVFDFGIVDSTLAPVMGGLLANKLRPRRGIGPKYRPSLLEKPDLFWDRFQCAGTPFSLQGGRGQLGKPKCYRQAYHPEYSSNLGGSGVKGSGFFTLITSPWFPGQGVRVRVRLRVRVRVLCSGSECRRSSVQSSNIEGQSEGQSDRLNHKKGSARM